MAKQVVVTVISDLVTDQRVHKVCQTLHDHGYHVLLVGSRKRDSLALLPRGYRTRRIGMVFQKRFLFYAEFNLRLFFRLLFCPADVLLGNDLDVMPATYLAGRLRRKPVVYDTHEYFLAMAGLEKKPFISKVWKRIESFIFPRVNRVYTICDSFCTLYSQDYHRDLVAVRNVPYLKQQEYTGDAQMLHDIDGLIPRDKYILLFQGAGINAHRGVEELVLAMRFLDPHAFHLIIVGGGEVLGRIKKMVAELRLTDRITFIPKVPFEMLRHITRQAHLGLSLDKSENLNHRYGLPNKIFDYLHAGVPVVASRLVELEKIVNTYQVGTFIEEHHPEAIAACIESVFADPVRMQVWRDNTERARQELNWEIEGKIVLEIFEQLGQEKVN